METILLERLLETTSKPRTWFSNLHHQLSKHQHHFSHLGKDPGTLAELPMPVTKLHRKCLQWNMLSGRGPERSAIGSLQQVLLLGTF